MSEKERPYVTECSFCGNGLLRPALCPTCGKVVAICDECELIWNDVAAVYENPKIKSDGAYPNCPYCEKETQWDALDEAGLEARDLDGYITDISS